VSGVARSSHTDRLVVAIGVFKLVKCGLLGSLSLAWLLGIGRGDSMLHAARWTGALAAHHAVRSAITRLTSLDSHLLRELAIASLIYAVVFAVEGTGLIMRKRWAEWLTVVVTASFIPLEVYELLRRPGPGKAFAVALNVAIVAYLARRRMTADAGQISHFRPA
jgi:uncharacterized membrane protein (DUF2068 family)